MSRGGFVTQQRSSGWGLGGQREHVSRTERDGAGGGLQKRLFASLGRSLPAAPGCLMLPRTIVGLCFSAGFLLAQEGHGGRHQMAWIPACAGMTHQGRTQVGHGEAGWPPHPANLSVGRPLPRRGEAEADGTPAVRRNILDSCLRGNDTLPRWAERGEARGLSPPHQKHIVGCG